MMMMMMIYNPIIVRSGLVNASKIFLAYQLSSSEVESVIRVQVSDDAACV